VDETRRLYGVLDHQLGRQRGRGIEAVAGEGLSIADFALFGWARKWKDFTIGDEEFPEVHRWLDTLNARPAVQRALAIQRPEPADPGPELAAHARLLGRV